MVWHNLPRRGFVAPVREANYRSTDAATAPGAADKAVEFPALIGPYVDFFAYGGAAGGNETLLIERLLRLETCAAPLDAAIAPMWQDLARVPLTVAEDEHKQRIDRLFGIDGKAGLLGALRRHRHVASNDLPAMSGTAASGFLDGLLEFAGDLLPDGAGADLWPDAQGGAATWMALPLYLQTLALITVVRGWIGRVPYAAELAAIRRHAAFLAGERIAPVVRHPAAAAACDAAARALVG